MDIIGYRVIVEEIDVKNSSDFLNNITIQGYFPTLTAPKILSFKSIDDAVEAISNHYFSWQVVQRVSGFCYDVVPLYENEDWGKPVKRFEKKSSGLPLEEISID